MMMKAEDPGILIKYAHKLSRVHGDREARRRYLFHSRCSKDALMNEINGSSKNRGFEPQPAEYGTYYNKSKIRQSRHGKSISEIVRGVRRSRSS
jgi:hypothetical protein